MERSSVVLRDSNDRALAEMVDDVVSVIRQGRAVNVFREIGIEVLDAEDHDAELMVDHVSRILRDMGAEPTSIGSTSAALGPRSAADPDVPVVPLPGPDGTAADVLHSLLAQQVRHLLMSEISARRGLPGSVDEVREAVRRLRAIMSTFRPLLDRPATDPLPGELKWLEGELSAIGSTDVLTARLDRNAEQLAEAADTARSRAVFEPAFAGDLESARARVLAALRSERHRVLRDDLVTAAARPAFTDDALTPFSAALLPLVAATWASAERSVAKLRIGSPGRGWKAARKKARRAQGAAESVTAVFGSRMGRYGDSLADAIGLLDEQGTARRAQSTIKGLAGRDGIDGLTGLALGLLYASQGTQQVRDRARLISTWPSVRRCARNVGLR